MLSIIIMVTSEEQLYVVIHKCFENDFKRAEKKDNSYSYEFLTFLRLNQIEEICTTVDSSCISYRNGKPWARCVNCDRLLRVYPI